MLLQVRSLSQPFLLHFIRILTVLHIYYLVLIWVFILGFWFSQRLCSNLTGTEVYTPIFCGMKQSNTTVLFSSTLNFFFLLVLSSVCNFLLLLLHIFKLHVDYLSKLYCILIVVLVFVWTSTLISIFGFCSSMYFITLCFV